MAESRRGRRRLPVATLESESLELDGDAMHYVVHVLRLGVGDSVELFDGRGAVGRGEIIDISAGRARLRVVERRRADEAHCALHVALATPKGERADWVVEKLTELGVARIVWLVCERSVVIPRGSNRQARWLRLAEAAARQCGRATVPIIEGPVTLAEFATQAAVHKLVADRSAQRDLWSAAAELTGITHLVVGPEGGFSDPELAMLRDEGYTTARLAGYTLRVETAAVAAAAVVAAAVERESKADA